MRFCLLILFIPTVTTTSNILDDDEEAAYKVSLLVSRPEAFCNTTHMTFSFFYMGEEAARNFPGHIYMRGHQKDSDPNAECQANARFRSTWLNSRAVYAVPFAKCGTTVGRSVSSQRGFFVSGTFVIHMHRDRDITTRYDLHYNHECLFLDQNKRVGYDKRGEMCKAVTAKFGERPQVMHRLSDDGSNKLGLSDWKPISIANSVDHELYCYPKDPWISQVEYNYEIFRDQGGTPDALADTLINAMDKYVVHTSSDEHYLLYANFWSRVWRTDELTPRPFPR